MVSAGGPAKADALDGLSQEDGLRFLVFAIGLVMV